jgi:hypothetical protein
MASVDSRRHVNTEPVGLVQPKPQRPGYSRFVRRECIERSRIVRRRLPICGRPLSGKGKRWGRCCARSDAVICPAFDAAERQPPACMGVRGPGPNHPKRARSTVESPGCPSPVSPTVAPYSPSARPHVLAIVVSLRRRDRSSVGATFDQKGPDDAGHLVGQSNGDQHFRLASQHLRQPRALGCPAPAGLLNHGTRPNDQ